MLLELSLSMAAPIFFILIVVFLLIYYSLKVVRINWVYINRAIILDEDPNEYYKLPSYDYMCRRWWIWDIEEFKDIKEG
jgi:hypothetical protein